ncbi:twin-arginine translocation pathway signal protein [Pseudomonas neustonica]|uniref:Twin-arginine translocation pathway signal protein n=2 Tax=Pseudomonas TaxID=286 RepID=A0ABX9XPN8_9PSED|nr:twin-arginine translocation pathway signal protein [Pseudomonas sp. SSM44]ROZ87890.1 twin-arginine translocation pathway signal protein [Pseudomonas neustonica]
MLNALGQNKNKEQDYMDPNLNPQLGRRSLLKLGLGASLALSTVGLTASLTGCTSEHAAPQFKVLRESDLPLLAALYPAIIGPHPAFAESSDAIAKASAQLDWTLERTSPFVQKSILDLLGLLSMPVTRGPLTGVWGDMAKASPDQIEAFLLRWRDSRFDMLRQGQKTLTQLLQMSWYALPQSWATTGYPGPPVI